MTVAAFNCVIGTQIYSDVGVLYTPALSGGSWGPSADTPLTNVQDRTLANVARSTDATTASTQFDIDFGVVRNCRIFAILITNATSAATVRFRLSNVAGDFSAPTYDSTAVLVLPAGATAETLEGMNVWKTLVPSADKNGRYCRVEIDDHLNPANYVDVARVAISAGWQPSINLDYGAQVTFETDTIRQKTVGGSAVYGRRPVSRLAKFALKDLSNDELLTNGFDLQRIAGTDRQLFFVFDPTDTTHMHRRAFLGVLRSLTALEFAYFSRGNMPWEIAEEL